MKIYQGTKIEEAHVVRRQWWGMMSYYVKDSSGPWAGAIRRDQRSALYFYHDGFMNLYNPNLKENTLLMDKDYQNGFN